MSEEMFARAVLVGGQLDHFQRLAQPGSAGFVNPMPALDFLTGDYYYRGSDGEDLVSSMAQHSSGRRTREKAGSAARVVMKFDDFEAFVAEYFGDTHTLSLPRATFQALGGYPEDFKKRVNS